MLLAPRRAPTATRPAGRRHGCSSHRPLDPVPLFLPSRHHSTAVPSPERYGSRYEVEGRTNFLELRLGEVRRTLLLGTSMNKGQKTNLTRMQWAATRQRWWARQPLGLFSGMPVSP